MIRRKTVWIITLVLPVIALFSFFLPFAVFKAAHVSTNGIDFLFGTDVGAFHFGTQVLPLITLLGILASVFTWGLPRFSGKDGIVLSAALVGFVTALSFLYRLDLFYPIAAAGVGLWILVGSLFLLTVITIKSFLQSRGKWEKRTTTVPILDNLDDGHIFCYLVSGFLLLIAGLFVITWFLYLIPKMIAQPLGFYTVSSLILRIIQIALFIAFVGVIVLILVYRSKKIRTLVGSSFTIIPIIANLLKLGGEILFSKYLFAGLIVALSIWFNDWTTLGIGHLDWLNLGFDIGLGQLLTFGSPAVHGLLVMFTDVIYATIVLLIAYFLYEAIYVIVDIARNVETIVKENDKA